MSEAYSALFRDYDKLNSETDYAAWADFLSLCFEKYMGKAESVLDMGCGTGAMTFALHDKGFDMTGIDLNPDMLSIAADICAEKEISDILWLCQDMRSFELYGTVDAVVCCLDGINHLCEKGDLEKCFSLCHNYLNPNGLFVFDVNTPEKFESFYGENDYILEDDGVMCCWQNDYNREKGVCDFYLTVFEEDKNGKWERTDTVQRERCYSKEELCKALTDNGFEICGFFSDFSFKEATEKDHRWYIAAKVCDK